MSLDLLARYGPFTKGYILPTETGWVKTSKVFHINSSFLSLLRSMAGKIPYSKQTKKSFPVNNKWLGVSAEYEI